MQQKPIIISEYFLVIKPSKGRILLFFFLISIFVVVGLGLMILPSNKTSIIPLGQFLQPLVGCIGLLFGLVGYATLFIRMQKPIIAFNAQGIRYYRNNAVVLWHDISNMEIVREWGGNKVRWIYVNVHDPKKYEMFERLNKRYGMIDADLVFDFSLASQADYEKLCNLMLELRWFYANVDEPEKSQMFEELNRRYGMIDADSLVDFPRTSQAEKERGQ